MTSAAVSTVYLARFSTVVGPPISNFCIQIVQKEREEKLAQTLKDRLNQYVQGNKEDFVRHAEAEVARLSSAGGLSLTVDDCFKAKDYTKTSSVLFSSAPSMNCIQSWQTQFLEGWPYWQPH